MNAYAILIDILPFLVAFYLMENILMLRQGWMVLSLTSERSTVSPIWLGVARYGLATVGFAALFAIRPTSDPLAVLAGSAMALFLPSALIANNKWSGR